MKSLPAIIALSTVAILLLLAVAASLIASISFAYVASYVVGFSCAAGMVASLIADYGPRSPRLIALPVRDTEPVCVSEFAEEASDETWAILPAARPRDEAILERLTASIGMRSDPATLSIT